MLYFGSTSVRTTKQPNYKGAINGRWFYLKPLVGPAVLLPSVMWAEGKQEAILKTLKPLQRLGMAVREKLQVEFHETSYLWKRTYSRLY